MNTENCNWKENAGLVHYKDVNKNCTKRNIQSYGSCQAYYGYRSQAWAWFVNSLTCVFDVQRLCEAYYIMLI